MNATQIHTTFKSALHFLLLGELKNAFARTRMLVDELQIGEFSDKLEDIQQNYRFLLKYFIDGIEDPDRRTVYKKLIAKTFVLNSELHEELQFRNSSNFEYTQKRYFPHLSHHTSLADLFEALKYYHTHTLLLKSSEMNHEVELNRIRINYEASIPELFGVFWLTTNYKSDEKLLFSSLMHNDYPGWMEKTMLVSALTLNLWRMFDENKLLLLFDCCLSDLQIVKQRALVGLCFVLAKYNNFLSYFPSIRNRLVLLTDDNHIVENFQTIIIQLIGTAETEKISKKMQEEILPEMLKISPLLKDKMDTDSLLNSDDWEDENPAWQEILDKSGVSDKLKELSEMQLEGADVYMSTFSMLKSFPFFSEFSNWFLPFDGQYTSINQLFNSEDKTLLDAFLNNNIMCNSDKYSFCLSIIQMPESQRTMLKNSFKMEAEQLDEMSKDEALLTPNLVAKNISKQYIQDLFRFFKLYPKHNEFSDMFNYSLTMHRSYLFDILSSNIDIRSDIAEYYFTKSHYIQALEMFEELAIKTKTNAALFQKIGYSFQQTSQLAKALDAYLKADIIQPDDSWTVKKIALCYRLSGQYEKALEYYQQADFLKPNESTILIQIGHCYLELRKFKEALNVYFKLDAEIDGDSKVWRAISWCSFVSGNIKQSDYYLQKLIENEPTATDFINAGHVALCQKKLNEAVSYYKQSLEMFQNKWEQFLDSFNKDKPYLIANGVYEEDIPLIIDELNPLTIF